MINQRLILMEDVDSCPSSITQELYHIWTTLHNLRSESNTWIGENRGKESLSPVKDPERWVKKQDRKYRVKKHSWVRRWALWRHRQSKMSVGLQSSAWWAMGPEGSGTEHRQGVGRDGRWAEDKYEEIAHGCKAESWDGTTSIPHSKQCEEETTWKIRKEKLRRGASPTPKGKEKKESVVNLQGPEGHPAPWTQKGHIQVLRLWHSTCKYSNPNLEKSDNLWKNAGKRQ